MEVRYFPLAFAPLGREALFLPAGLLSSPLPPSGARLSVPPPRNLHPPAQALARHLTRSVRSSDLRAGAFSSAPPRFPAGRRSPRSAAATAHALCAAGAALGLRFEVFALGPAARATGRALASLSPPGGAPPPQRTAALVLARPIPPAYALSPFSARSLRARAAAAPAFAEPAPVRPRVRQVDRAADLVTPSLPSDSLLERALSHLPRRRARPPHPPRER